MTTLSHYDFFTGKELYPHKNNVLELSSGRPLILPINDHKFLSQNTIPTLFKTTTLRKKFTFHFVC